MSFRKIALSSLSLAAVVACVGLAPAAQAADPAPAPATSAPAAGAALSTEQVQQIVHDYIVANPQLIMDSVDSYMKKTKEAHSVQGLKQNKDNLLKDASSPETGNTAGDVTVVEFFDYNCHFCKGSFPAIQSLLDKDKNIRVVFKEYPILGPSSETAAKWALAANKQNKYFAFHSAMMNNKEQITDDLLAKVAKSVGMDVDKAKTDISSPDVLAEITKNRTLADQLDIHGTPAFIIGDDISAGAIPEDEMEQKIKAIRDAAAKK